MLLLQNISYRHPDKEILFSNINLAMARHSKIALVGNNGSGKSTLLQLMAGTLQPGSGLVKADELPYYIPQLFGQYNHLAVAEALGVAEKLQALYQVLAGEVTEANLALLNDDWTLEERCQAALAHWQLEGIDLTQSMTTLSGGQKTKVFLAGIAIHQPAIVLMDEPSNHLDRAGRQLLYNFITSTTATLVVVSHDRQLLNLLGEVYELSKKGITVYGGNYDFYTAQKQVESHALERDVESKEKTLRKAKETEREAAERRQKLDARGKKKQEKAGVPTISMNTFKNNAEKSTARLKEVQAEKVSGIAQELNDLRAALPGADTMQLGFDNSALHTGKVLVTATELNYSYDDRPLWKQPLNFNITSGERIALTGGNGSGKTTLVKMILGQLTPQAGTIQRVTVQAVYIDQDYSLINNALTVYEQAQQFNTTALQEHEINIRLNRFLFTKQYWHKPCGTLSGGEKMRLLLCCLSIGHRAPDIIILDEPTNNLDIQNVDILTAAINQYKGTLLIISHDQHFLDAVGVQTTIDL